jgi:hypothetical protein
MASLTQQARRRRPVSLTATTALVLLLVACGPSEEEQFQAALSAASLALEDDDLVAAESLLQEARAVRPGAAAVEEAFSLLSTVEASAANYREAELLAEAAELLEARQLYLRVSPEDLARYSVAQERAQAIERDWIDETETRIEREIMQGDLEAALVSIREAERVFRGSEFLDRSIARLIDPVVDLAEQVSRERLSEGDLAAAQAALRNVTSFLPSADPSVAARIDAVRTDIGAERERRDRQRREEALARQPRAPVIPPVDIPATVHGPGGRECPSPAVDVEGWRECAFGEAGSPALPGPDPDISATVPGPDGRECPSPAVDVEGWRECVFGDRGSVVPPPPEPTAPRIPDDSEREAQQAKLDAAQREARLLQLRSSEARLLAEYQRLWAEDNAAQIEYQRRVRDFDGDIQRLQNNGDLGAAAIEMMRKQQYLQEQQAQRLDRTGRLNAAERELAAVRSEIDRIS